MRKAVFALAVFLVASSALAASQWWSAYQRGMKAVGAQDWTSVAAEMKKAIASEPRENASAVVRGRAETYLPHYWLGVALYHLGDANAAVREWNLSDSQGAIQKTDRYSDLRRWLSTVEADKAKARTRASQGSRSSADAALDSALKAQIQAMSGGADQTDTYRAALQKLQDARRAYSAAGDDVSAYEKAASLAADARALFDKASDETRSRRAAVARTQPPPTGPPVVAPTQEASPANATPKAPEETRAPVQSTTAGAGPAIAPAKEPEAIPATTSTTARSVAETTTARPETSQPQAPPTERAKKEAAVASPATSEGEDLLVRREVASARSTAEVVRRAWLRFAGGDVSAAEALMTAVIDTDRGTPEAYVIRGCARYTRAILTNRSDLLDAARQDFIVAIEKKPSLRLDEDHFSPKLVEFFEQTRNQM